MFIKTLVTYVLQKQIIFYNK